LDVSEMVSVFEVIVKNSQPFLSLEAQATVHAGFVSCRVR